MNLTQAVTKRAKCDEGKTKQFFYDTELKGFMLEVRSNGRKTFFLKVTTQEGKRKSTRLGDATILPTAEARSKALKLKRAIEEGKDVTLSTPIAKDTITLNEFYIDYYLPQIKLHNKSYKHNMSTFKVHILPRFGKELMNKITSQQISNAQLDMLTSKKLKNGTANKLVFFLRHAFKMAIDMKIAGILENPANNVKKLEELHRQRYITKVDVQVLMKVARNSKNQLLKYIIPFLLLTGARKNEVLRAKWSDVDFHRSIWTIPITKNKKIRKLPISKELKKLIHEIPRKSRFLFPSPYSNRHLHLCYKTWDTVRKKAGLHDLRIHDLRHSYASILVNSGRSIYEVQTLLGHSDTKMTQRYAHLSNESLMKAASCAGKLLE